MTPAVWDGGQTMLAEVLDLIKIPRHLLRYVGVGILLTFISSFGQNFFLAVFGGEFRIAFALSNGQFGSLYSALTITSAVALIWLGRVVDRLSARLVGFITVLALACAALLLSRSHHVASLFVALLGVRLFGQGMAVQLSVTAVTRHADFGARGRALSLSTIGNPIGEATLPLAAVSAMAWLGWRNIWLAIAAVLVLVVLPSLLVLLKDEAVPDLSAGGAASSAHAAAERRAWTVSEVLRHPLIYLLVPGLLAPNVLNTAIFFHQVALAQAKGWGPAWFVASYPVASAANICATLAVGWLIDRVGSLRVLPLALVPQFLAVILLAVADHPAVIPAYMALAGGAMGVSLPLQGVILADIYGTQNFGAIRAVVSACNVLFCALSPAAVGWSIDTGVSFEVQFAVMAVALLICAVFLLLGQSIARTALPRARVTSSIV